MSTYYALEGGERHGCPSRAPGFRGALILPDQRSFRIPKWIKALNGAGHAAARCVGVIANRELKMQAAGEFGTNESVFAAEFAWKHKPRDYGREGLGLGSVV
jgi:hypothetical protein